MPFLLERLAHTHYPAGQAAPFDLRAAIAAQIQRIVGARMVDSGDGELSLLEFGMPNVVELSLCSSADLARYASRLERLVARYEPRLLGARVTVHSTGLPSAPYRLAVSGVPGPGQDSDTFLFELPSY